MWSPSDFGVPGGFQAMFQPSRRPWGTVSEGCYPLWHRAARNQAGRQGEPEQQEHATSLSPQQPAAQYPSSYARDHAATPVSHIAGDLLGGCPPGRSVTPAPSVGFGPSSPADDQDQQLSVHWRAPGTGTQPLSDVREMQEAYRAPLGAGFRGSQALGLPWDFPSSDWMAGGQRDVSSRQLELPQSGARREATGQGGDTSDAPHHGGFMGSLHRGHGWPTGENAQLPPLYPGFSAPDYNSTNRTAGHRVPSRSGDAGLGQMLRRPVVTFDDDPGAGRSTGGPPGILDNWDVPRMRHASAPIPMAQQQVPWRAWEQPAPAGNMVPGIARAGPHWNDNTAPVAAKPKRPPPFDGKSGCRDYLVQFDMIAKLNRWDGTTKAMELATSLKGTAVSILTDLEPEYRRDYGRLVSALLARFEPDNQSEVFRAQLKGKRRRGQEALTELAQDVRTLARKAYPHASMTIRETIARDCFIDALNDAELEWSVYREKPTSLTDALTTALEHEAFKTGRLRRTGGTGQVVRSQQETAPKETGNDADQVLGRLAALLEDRERSPQTNRDRKSSSKGKGACFYCG